MKPTSIDRDIARYREAVHRAYGADYGSRITVRHVRDEVVAITFPKGGRVLVRRDHLHTLTEVLNAKARQVLQH